MPAEQPLGEEIDWTPALAPGRPRLRGAHVLVRPLDAAADAEQLHAVSHAPGGDPRIWTYLPYGPYGDAAEMRRALEAAEASREEVFFTLVRLADERPLGVSAYLRVTPESGVIEIGHVWFAPELQRTTAASEAIYLLAGHAFEDLGYRRLEWKCNALNGASRRAAERFGFTFEGVFRKHMVVKGRNRDSAWFAMTDEDWPAVRRGFEAWLARANSDEQGRQRRTLSELIGEARREPGPTRAPAPGQSG
jgi:RimJ/RimL family protein N-acetyltransferase